jgi:hypothetical protein
VFHARVIAGALLSVFVITAAWADREDPLRHDDDEEVGVRWQEQEKLLPAYPQDAGLIEIKPDGARAAHQYRLDPQSLTTHPDGVVTYTVVVQSESGAQNVLFEGIRCASKEYKTYAIGAEGGRLEPVKQASWRKIFNKDPIRHRIELYTYYACDAHQFALPPKRIIERLRHPDRIPSPYASGR